MSYVNSGGSQSVQQLQTASDIKQERYDFGAGSVLVADAGVPAGGAVDTLSVYRMEPTTVRSELPVSLKLTSELGNVKPDAVSSNYTPPVFGLAGGFVAGGLTGAYSAITSAAVIKEAMELGAIGGLLVADATFSGAIAGGVVGAAVGLSIGVGIVAYNYYQLPRDKASLSPPLPLMLDIDLRGVAR
jgi:hypothetical protein